MMNSVIAVTVDAATAKSNYLVMVEGPDGPVPSVSAALHADVLVRESAGWRFPPAGTGSMPSRVRCS